MRPNLAPGREMGQLEDAVTECLRAVGLLEDQTNELWSALAHRCKIDGPLPDKIDLAEPRRIVAEDVAGVERRIRRVTEELRSIRQLSAAQLGEMKLITEPISDEMRAQMSRAEGNR